MLIKNKSEFSFIFDDLPIGVLILDVLKNYELVYCNNFVTKITGYSFKELKDKKIIFKLILQKEKEDFKTFLFNDCNENVTFKIKSKSENYTYCNAYCKKVLTDKYSYFVISFTDVTKNVLQSELLGKTNIILKNFAYITAHDLKSPLISLNSLSEKLIEEINLIYNFVDKNYNIRDNDFINKKNKIRKLALMIKDSADMMIETVDISLKYSNTDKVEYSTFNINIAINSAKRSLKAVRSNSSKPVIYNIINTKEITADLSKMVLLFQNIFSNSIKFNDKDKVKIDIWVDEDKDSWIINCRDNGTGIKKQNLNRVFSLYKRANKDNYDGAGLGLAIIERIVEKHKGEVKIESEFKKYTLIKIKLPKCTIKKF